MAAVLAVAIFIYTTLKKYYGLMVMTLSDVKQKCKSKLSTRIIENQYKDDDIDETELVFIVDECCPESMGMIQTFLYSNPQVRMKDRYQMTWMEEIVGIQNPGRLQVLGYLFDETMSLLKESKESDTVAIVNVKIDSLSVQVMPERLFSLRV